MCDAFLAGQLPSRRLERRRKKTPDRVSVSDAFCDASSAVINPSFQSIVLLNFHGEITRVLILLLFCELIGERKNPRRCRFVFVCGPDGIF
jgi:hypothetical protein